MRYAYDLEVYKNFFSATFVDLDSDNCLVFVCYGKHDGRESLKKFLLSPGLTLTGFNSVGYDDLVLKYILEDNPKKPLERFLKNLYNLSQYIISERDTDDFKVRALRWASTPYKSIDPYLIKAFNKLGVSLKQIAINLKWYRVQDLPIHWDSEIKDSDVSSILDYNKNDVLITKALYQAIHGEVVLRESIKETSGIDVTNRSKSTIANSIFEVIYEQKTGISKSEFKNLRTFRDSVAVADCISPKIRFTSEYLKEFLEEIKALTLECDNDFKFKKVVEYTGITFDVGIGGLHSRDEPGIFRTTSDVEILDADVGSFYPNIMINDRVKPEHLSDEFIDVLKDITRERLEAKHLTKTLKKQGLDAESVKQSLKAETLKITINSIFGKLGFAYYWLYDPKAMLKVTLNGQLYLLMLIEMFTETGIQVISANTDGVVCKVSKHQKEVYKRVCEQWQQMTAFELEFTTYQSYFRRDVNNYLTIKSDGEVKTKGCFEWKVNLEKGYKYPIVAESMFKYFAEGIPIETTIRNHQNIYDFLLSRKTGFGFKMFYQEPDKEPIELQKNNRYYASLSGGYLYQEKPEKKMAILKDQKITILNTVDESLGIESYGIDYDFYIAETRKIIDVVEGRIEEKPKTTRKKKVKESNQESQLCLI